MPKHFKNPNSYQIMSVLIYDQVPICERLIWCELFEIIKFNIFHLFKYLFAEIN